MLELQGESGDENEVQAPIRRKKVKVSCANTYLHSTYLLMHLCTKNQSQVVAKQRFEL